MSRMALTVYYSSEAGEVSKIVEGRCLKREDSLVRADANYRHHETGGRSCMLRTCPGEHGVGQSAFQRSQSESCVLACVGMGARCRSTPS